MKHAGWVWNLSCFSLLACLLTAVPAAAAQVEVQQKLSANDALQRYTSGPPLTPGTLRSFIEALPEWVVLQAIQNRGVDFDSRQENLDLLRTAGASEPVLKLVREKAQRAPVASPTPPPTGTLVLTCAPSECAVSINGRGKEETVGGKRELEEIPVGGVYIDFVKQGYVDVKKEATVEAGKKKEVGVTLEPTPETRAKFGRELLAAMLVELGAERT